jgi:hypothetical protein
MLTRIHLTHSLLIPYRALTTRYRQTMAMSLPWPISLSNDTFLQSSLLLSRSGCTGNMFLVVVSVHNLDTRNWLLTRCIESSIINAFVIDNVAPYVAQISNKCLFLSPVVKLNYWTLYFTKMWSCIFTKPKIASQI